MKVIRAILEAYFAILFYPALIGMFIWLWIKGAHWGWGVLILGLILVFDPLWRRLIFRK